MLNVKAIMVSKMTSQCTGTAAFCFYLSSVIFFSYCSFGWVPEGDVWVVIQLVFALQVPLVSSIEAHHRSVIIMLSMIVDSCDIFHYIDSNYTVFMCV